METSPDKWSRLEVVNHLYDEWPFVFYGSTPLIGQPAALPVDKSALGKISAPVYGFYAANDARINATLPATVEAMKELNKKYEPVTYEGAGHGFMRAGDAPEPVAPVAQGDADKSATDKYEKDLTAYKANKKARDDAWVRWKVTLASANTTRPSPETLISAQWFRPAFLLGECVRTTQLRSA